MANLVEVFVEDADARRVASDVKKEKSMRDI